MTMRRVPWLAASVLALAFLSCARSPFPSSGLRPGTAMAQLAVYFEGPSEAEAALARARSIVAAEHPDIAAAEDQEALYPDLGPSDARCFFSLPPSIEEYAPPSEEMCAYFARGIPEADFPRIAALDAAVILDFAYGGERIAECLRAAYGIAGRIADETGGYVWDETTREIFGRDEWKSRREDDVSGEIPILARHVTVHYYRDGKLFRQISLGMEKFGLPNIVVNQLTANSSDSVNSLINLAAQSLYEGASVDGRTIILRIDGIRQAEFRKGLEDRLSSGAGRTGFFYALSGKREEGDPYGPLLELAAPGSPWKSPQTRMSIALSDLFGSDDGVVNVQHDEELLQASARAKERLPALKKEFDGGLEAGGYLDVKLPFGTSAGGTEWMWVEVTEWNDGTIAGVLVNEPADVPGLEEGATVSGKESDVFDYIRRYGDGREEGNETGRIIQRSQSSR